MESSMQQKTGSYLPVHSQVRKIKQEDEKIIREQLKPWMLERQPAIFIDLSRRQRSPLGRTVPSISVGN